MMGDKNSVFVLKESDNKGSGLLWKELKMGWLQVLDYHVTS